MEKKEEKDGLWYESRTAIIYKVICIMSSYFVRNISCNVTFILVLSRNGHESWDVDVINV